MGFQSKPNRTPFVVTGKTAVKLETFVYKRRSGWSVAALPALDSDQTVVLVFGAPSFRQTPEPIQALIRAYPRSHIIGCSSSGEISPYTSGYCDLHNQTMTLTTLSEE